MTNEQLIAMLQEDLQNERKHLASYVQFAVAMRGPHREELRKFCELQSADELNHVTQFSELIVHLGGTPGTEVNPYPENLSCPVEILKHIIEMENEVAEKYAERLRATAELENSATAYAHNFYSEQLLDSWKTAREVEQMLPGQEAF